MSTHLHEPTAEAGDLPVAPTRPAVFLDTGALLAGLEPGGPAAPLFGPGAAARVRYVTAPVVVQEAVLAGGDGARRVAELLGRGGVEVREVPGERVAEFLAGPGRLRDRPIHANGLLALFGAADCDYLVTRDAALAGASADRRRPVVLSPEAFAAEVLAPA